MRFAKTLTILGLLLVNADSRAQQSTLGAPYPATPAVAPAPAPLPASLPAGQSAPALGPAPRTDASAASAPAAPVVGPPPTPVVGPAPTPVTGSPPPYYVPPGGLPPPYPPPGYVPMAYPAPMIPGDRAGNPAFWVGVEALLWWSKNQPLPVPVLTTGPAALGATAGNLGVPGTTSLNGPLDLGAAGGVRLFAGAWFDSAHVFGIDGSIFFLGRASTGFAAVDRSGSGAFVINEPVNGAPFITQVSAPGLDTGGAAVTASSRFAGGDANFLYNLYRGNGWTVNLLAGYRYLELDENLEIAANSSMFATTVYTDNAGNVLVTAPPGSTITVVDRFGTRNQFNGGQVGVDVQYLWGRWSVGGSMKLAIGATHEVVAIDGNTLVFPANGTPTPLTGGNFATLQTGRYAQNRFALAPEAQLTIGYQITPWLRATVGYNFLYLSSVLRPGNQIDNGYDGVAHPGVPMSSSGYWTQGLNLGLRFSF